MGCARLSTTYSFFSSGANAMPLARQFRSTESELPIGRRCDIPSEEIRRRLAPSQCHDAKRRIGNQIEPSDLHTMSFGELSRLPSNLSASTVILRRTRCASHCASDARTASSRSLRSRAKPLEKLDGW